MATGKGDLGAEAELAGRSALLLVAGLAIGMYGGFAVVFIQSFGVFVKPISLSLGWGRAQVALITTMGFLGYSLTSPILGALIDRLGPRLVMAFGVALFATGVALLAVLPGVLPLIALVSFLIGAVGSATAPSGYILVLSKTVRERLGLKMGLAMLGLGVGAFTIPVMAQTLIGRFGWRGAYLALAGLALVLGVIAWMLMFGGRRSAPAPARAVGPTLDGGLSLKAALKTYPFWLIAIAGGLISGAGFGATAHLAAALSDRGVSLAMAARIAGAAGLGIMVGRTGSAILMDLIFAPLVGTAGFMLGALGLYLISSAPVGLTGLLFLAAFLAGMLVGAEGDVMPFLTRRYFGARSFGAIYGSIAGLAGLGGIFGPLAFGLAFDRTGSYRSMLVGAAVVCAVSGLALLTLGRYPFPQPHRSGAARVLEAQGEPA